MTDYISEERLAAIRDVAKRELEPGCRNADAPVRTHREGCLCKRPSPLAQAALDLLDENLKLKTRLGLKLWGESTRQIGKRPRLD